MSRHQTMDISEAYTHSGFGRFQYKTALPLMLGGNIFMAFNMCIGIFTLYENKPNDKIQIDTVFKEFDLTDFQAKLINSGLMLGVLVGNSLIGKLADSYGRRSVGLILVPLTIFLMVFSTFLTFDFISYAIWRFLNGVTNGGLGVSLTVLTLELIDNKYWSYFCVAGAATFGAALAVLALLAKFFTTWRALTLVTAIPNLYLVYIVFVMPESPRWLFSIGQVDQAESIMQNIAKQNGKSSTTSLGGSAANRPVQEGGMDIFMSRPARTRLLVMVILWFSASLIYYGLTLGAGSLGDNIFENTAFSGLAELPGYVLCLFLMENKFFGRKYTCVLCYSVTCVLMLAIDIFNLESTNRLVLALSAKMLVSGAFSIIYTYCCELFPTTVRSVGLGWSSMSARLGGILAPFAVQLGALIRDNDENSGFLFYSVFAVISTAALFLIPETLNAGLYDNIKALERGSRRDAFGDDVEGQSLLED